MKRMLIFSMSVVLLGGCESRMAGPQSLSNKNGQVFTGQSSDSVEKNLGAPDIVSEGYYCKNAWAGGYWFQPGTRTIEWVFLDWKPDTALIVWIDAGRVARIGEVGIDEVRE